MNSRSTSNGFMRDAENNLKNVRHEDSSLFRNKNRKYL
jgi:hypothetical protein